MEWEMDAGVCGCCGGVVPFMDLFPTVVEV